MRRCIDKSDTQKMVYNGRFQPIEQLLIIKNSIDVVQIFAMP